MPARGSGQQQPLATGRRCFLRCKRPGFRSPAEAPPSLFPGKGVSSAARERELRRQAQSKAARRECAVARETALNARPRITLIGNRGDKASQPERAAPSYVLMGQPLRAWPRHASA